MTSWRNRIVGHGEEDAEKLLANPRNWRIHPKHQQDALSGVLDEVGWVQSVIVNRQTGFVVDGHLRVAMAISKGEKVPVVYVDLDPAEEALVLATLDPLSGLSVPDYEQLESLIDGISVGTEAVATLLEDLERDAEKVKFTDGEDSPDVSGSDEMAVGGRSVVNILIAVENLMKVESALAATGLQKRGEALTLVCEEYLKGHGQEKG